MYPLRVLGRVVLGLGLLLLGVGGALCVGSAVVAGDRWLAGQPWIGIGLTALVLGLGIVGIVGLILDVIEPIGRVRIFAIPPALIAGFLWLTTYIAPASGACCEQPERDIRTMLYSMPEALIALTIATLGVLIPLAIARRRLERRRSQAG